MTQTRRIILNVVATYGRTLFSVACGLFTVRWVMMVLGHEDFGIYGVVGSMTIFVTFLNTQLSDALARFYAVSIGKLRTAADKKQELEDCRAWFSCGVAIHVVVPLLLMSIGYPMGVYALDHGWVDVPVGKMHTCVWLWRFSCVSALVAMMNSPFHAMYIAHQYIAELTIYGFAQTVIRTGFIYIMTIIPMDWLFGYGLGCCLIGVVPQLIICGRAFVVFETCRLRITAFFDLERIRRVSSFAWWKAFGGIGYIARHQCQAIIVNRHFGPKANAAYSVATTFGAEATSLAGSLNMAFAPAINSAYGEGKMDVVSRMAMRSCKFGALLTLAFAIPMLLEANKILVLWLKNPPAHAAPMCMTMLGVVIVDKLTSGHYMSVMAVGNIRGMMFLRGAFSLLAIPTSILAVKLAPMVEVVPLALLLVTILTSVADVYYARVVAKISIMVWIRTVLLPLVLVAVPCLVIGAGVVYALDESFLRICITTFVCLTSIALLGWLVLLDTEEKSYVLNRIRRRHDGV